MESAFKYCLLTFIRRRCVGPIRDSRRRPIPRRPRSSAALSRNSSILGRSLSRRPNTFSAPLEFAQNFLAEEVVGAVQRRDGRARVCRRLSSRRVSRRFAGQRRLQHSLLPLQEAFHRFLPL
jgi:hypothetical protein